MMNRLIPYSDSYTVPETAALALSVFPDETEYVIFPGFCDVHVHFREPGFSYKETIRSGSRAAAAGGYTTVCTMPNLSPVPDSLPHLNVQWDLIAQGAAIRVMPFGAITVGEKGTELADLAAMAPYVCGFSDDGRGVQSAALMKEAMRQSGALGRIRSAHCEDERCPGTQAESEWRPIERDIRLAEETGCAYHVCHISCRESVELIRDAKASGVNISCETAPHYLLLDDSMLGDDGRFKMNPPIRSRADREALLEGLLDGTIDMIATDHAPHSAEEKARGFAKSLNGIIGLETAFPMLYTELVRKGVLSLEKLVSLMSEAPRRRFGLPAIGDYAFWQLDEAYTLDPSAFLSLGRSTPFEGRTVYGRCMATVSNNKLVYLRKNGKEA